ncbi:protein tyrosine phosphatase family protein [Pseudomonadota bacterium]
MTKLSNIKNHRQLTPTLHTAGQPDAAQLAQITRHEINTVINLGLADAEYAVSNEAQVLTNASITYFHIPVEFTNPTATDFDTFKHAMEQSAATNTLIHCAANKRAICFTALWGQLALGWSEEEADKHISSVWAVTDTWCRFLGEMRQQLGLTN